MHPSIHPSMRCMQPRQFPTLLVDEACQACEAETLPALCTTVQRMSLWSRRLGW